MEFYGKVFQDLTGSQVYEILKSRSEIFMLEQGIRCLDMDDVDYKSRHCFFTEGDRVVAYLRAFYLSEDRNTVKIGRVLTLNHGRGVGTELMKKSIDDISANMKCKKLHVDAQKQAVGFYKKMGFSITSEEFLEEGIPHVSMEMEL